LPFPAEWQLLFLKQTNKTPLLGGSKFACSLPLCSTLATEELKCCYCSWFLSHSRVSVFLEEEQGKTLAGFVKLSENVL